MIKRFTFFIGLLLCSVGTLTSNGQEPTELGATPHAGGVMFRVWAPNATSVHVSGEFNNWNTSNLPLTDVGDGIWERNVGNAEVGQTYRYVINGSLWRRDPRAAWIVHSGEDMPSVIYDQDAYEWQSDPLVAPPLEELVIYELHIGTFNDLDPNDGGASNFDEARQRLDYLVDLGITAVKVMPVAEFPGYRSWGYNPSDLFAVHNRTYGGPDAFKRFVDAAHQRGLAVILDVVHNHYGPGDLEHSLWRFDGSFTGDFGGIYFFQDSQRAETRWGPRPNYSTPEVREFIKDNVRMWIEDYRINGFRWDATQFIRETDPEVAGVTQAAIPDGASLIREINDMIRDDYTGIINIAEDLQELASTTAPTPSGLGYDSDWHTGFHFEFTDELLEATPDLDRLVNRLNYNDFTRRVIYTESHDEVGTKNDKDRLPVRFSPSNPTNLVARRKSLLAAGFMYTAPGIPMLFQGQEMLETQRFHDDTPVRWALTNIHSGIVQFYQDASHLRRNVYGITGGLTGSVVTATAQTSWPGNPVLTMHRRNGGGVNDDVFVVGNLSDTQLDGDWIDWPHDGWWYVHLNSDDSKYGGSGFGSTAVEVLPPGGGQTTNRGEIQIAPWSVMVLSRAEPPSAHSGVNLVAGGNTAMRRVHDHLWSVDRELSSGSYSFRFNGTGPAANWGAGSIGTTWPLEGTAVTGTSNFSITLPRDGLYRFTLNSMTRQFSVRDITPIARGASHASMAIAGNFNDWTTTPNMTLNSNNVWELQQQFDWDFDFEFKFAAYDQAFNVSWGGTDTSQPQPGASGTAISQAGGDIIVEGPFRGEYRITFDDRTLQWEIEKTDLPPPPATMGVTGNFRGWNLAPNMTSDGGHVWTYTHTIEQSENLVFKFLIGDDWDDGNWGYNGGTFPNSFPVNATGVAFGDNIEIAGPFNGDYTFTFNSYTLEFSVTEQLPEPEIYGSMALAGNFNGWDPGANLMASNALHEWSYTTPINQSGAIQFKFVADGDWGGDDWGSTAAAYPNNFPVTGTAELNPGENNITINGPFSGDYTFTFNSATRQFTVAEDEPPPPPVYDSMAVAGSFNGWNNAPNMTQLSDYVWEYSTAITTNGNIAFKFVAEEDWDLGWGNTVTHPNSFPVTATAIFPAGFGEDITISGPFSGDYTFTINTATREYTVTFDGDDPPPPPPPAHTNMAVVGIAGDWSTTPNMTLNDQNIWFRDVPLNQSGAIQFKFVTGDSWDTPPGINWGDGTTHSSNNPATGTAAEGGDDITVPGPFDGTYRFTFNDNSLEYRVELVTTIEPPVLGTGGISADQEGLILQWQGEAGASYRVQHADTLVPFNFSDISPSLPTVQPMNVWTASIPNGATSGFYRIRRE